MASTSSKRKTPRNVKSAVRQAILLEAGYACANPICRVPLIEVHHIDYVETGGANTEDNLIALCPTCHARVHNRSIPDDAIRTWKVMVVAANHAWAKETLNALLFLDTELAAKLYLTGDGVVRFADLIVSGLAEAKFVDWVGDRSNVFVLEGYSMAVPASEMAKLAYRVTLTKKGQALVSAWKQGALDKLELALATE